MMHWEHFSPILKPRWGSGFKMPSGRVQGSRHYRTTEKVGVTQEILGLFNELQYLLF